MFWRGEGGQLSQPPKSASWVLMGLEGIDAGMTAVLLLRLVYNNSLFLLPFLPFGPIFVTANAARDGVSAREE
jgi:hypothetical protein